MCNPVGPAAASPMQVAPPSGCGAPAPPAGPPVGLQRQMEQGLEQLRAMGVNLPGSTSAGGPTSFAAAEAQTQAVPLAPASNGFALVENLDRVYQARLQRLAALEAGINADAQRTGAASPVDLQKLSMERGATNTIRDLAAALRPLAGTIDQTEAARVMGVVEQANREGSFNPASLALAMFEIKGSAYNLPASYMAQVRRAGSALGAVSEQVRLDSNAVADDARRRGSFDPVALQRLTQLTDANVALNVAVKRNFELAQVNPVLAEQRLAAALQHANDPVRMAQALG